MKRNVLFYLLFIFSLTAGKDICAQVNFSIKPMDYALVPRDLKTNLAEIRFAGLANAGVYSNVRFRTYKNGALFADKTFSVSTTSGTTNFDYRINLKAGKYHYSFQVIFSGKDSFVKTVNDIIIGDVYIIQGQSNAVANSYYGLVKPKYADSFIRSFGSSTYDPNYSYSDTSWHIADGDGYYGPGCIGQWGMVLAKSILDSFGVPVAILNGAVGGTPITYHQRYNYDPENIYTCYGRLLSRARKAKLSLNIRGFLYFQGESDAGQPKLHDSLFRVLYADWFKDYKGIQQNYLVQVRGNGCGGVKADILEYQRLFEFTLQKMKVISSNGLNGHDGCHYSMVNGYELLGKQLAALVSRDLYGSQRKTNIDPPGIASVYYSNASHTEIVLNLRQPKDSIFVDPNFENLFYLTGDNSVTITGGSVVNNRVVLKLNKGTCNPLYLTYLGNVGAQPWVKNSTKAGLVGFDQILIQKPIIHSFYYGCPGKDFFAGEDSIPGYTYKWIRRKDGSTKKTAKIKMNAATSEIYTAIMYYKNLTCSSDTFTVYITIDQTTAPDLGNDTTLCNGNSVSFKISENNYSKINWKQNNISVSNSAYSTDTSGEIYLDVLSNMGCAYKDSIRIKTSVAKLTLPDLYTICPGMDTLITAPVGFIKYKWNNNPTNLSTYRSKPGLLHIQVVNNEGCSADDSIQIAEFKASVVPELSARICPKDSVSFNRPVGFIQWFQSNKLLGKIAYFHLNSYPIIELKDSNGCKYSDTLLISAKPLPIFNLGKDTSVCQGNNVIFNCRYPAFIYEWNGTRTNSAKFETNIPGNYFCKVQNEEGCIFTDTVMLVNYLKPIIRIPSDTNICEGSVWKPYLDHSFQWTINGANVNQPELKYPGIYLFGVVDKNNCAASLNCNLYTIKCTNSIQNIYTNGILYPNPCMDYIMIQGFINQNLNWNISDIFGRQLMGGKLEHNMRIQVAELKAGIYYLNADSLRIKFIKI